MRKYLNINLSDQSIKTEELNGLGAIRVGRHFIAKTLLEQGAATADPLGPDNPLIFSAGPFAGSNFSNANRLSVGCKSPLTGGIKEANSGGTFAFALGQLGMAGFTLHGISDDWVIIHIPKEGDITFEKASSNSTNPNSVLDHKISSSPMRDKWTPKSAKAYKASTTKSLSDTASKELLNR